MLSFSDRSLVVNDIRHITSKDDRYLFECTVSGTNVISLLLDHGAIPKAATAERNAADREEMDVVGLTEEQKQLLCMAFERGYYEIPRRISQNELAHKLDISTSAISQRLRRDTEQLIGSTLAVEKDRR